MSLRIRFAGAIVAGLLAIAFSPGTALAGIPIIYGSGDTVSHVANLPENHPAFAVMPSAAIGYKYYRFHIYWCDLWTGSGEYCLYTDNNFMPLGNDPKEAAAKLGLPEASFHRPIFYLLLFGWLLIGGFLGVSTAGGLIQKYSSPHARAERLLKQPLYQEAWQLAATGNQGFDKGVSFLVGRGLTQEKAEENLTLLTAYHHALAQPEPPPTDAPVAAWEKPDIPVDL